MQARAVALKTRPEGMPTTDNFQIIDIDVPEPQDGEIQVENICMSVDPYMRGRMYDRKSYVPPFQIGEALTGGSIGKVSKSAHPDFQPGDYVSSAWGWREAYTASTEGIERVEVVRLPEGTDPECVAWFGAATLPDLETGRALWVTRHEWAQRGALAARRLLHERGRRRRCKVARAHAPRECRRLVVGDDRRREARGELLVDGDGEGPEPEALAEVGGQRRARELDGARAEAAEKPRCVVDDAIAEGGDGARLGGHGERALGAEGG